MRLKFMLFSTNVIIFFYNKHNLIYSSPLVTHVCAGSELVQKVACRLVGAKPISEPMLVDCQLDP